MAKKDLLSLGAIRALEMLKVEKSATAKDLKDLGFEKVNSSHLKALENRGLITSKDVEIEVITKQKRKVKEYTITEKGLESSGVETEETEETEES